MGMAQHRTYHPPFHAAFASALDVLVDEVFGAWDCQELHWRLEHMPMATVHASTEEGRLVAFKVGYASAQRRYHSWLGGVHPDYRHRGLARALIELQHRWAREHGFVSVETAAARTNQAMLALNRSCGFEVVGHYSRGGEERLRMFARL